MDKQSIAVILEQIGTLLELKGENPFKTKAYYSGARALKRMDDDLGKVIELGQLRKVPGIGAALAERIEILHETGELPHFEELKASIPKGLIEMLDIPGLGAKKIKAVYDKLEVDTIKKLQTACTEGEVAKLAGFGAKSQQKILDGIKNRETYGKRHLWWSANVVVNRILKGLQQIEEVKKVEVAGSYRRGMETVGDLDFIVGSDKPDPIMDWFANQFGVQEVTAKGQTKTSIRFEDGLQADLRVVSVEQFYFALHHFTGSKGHNVQMRSRALTQGLSLSEWGLGSEKGKEGHMSDSIKVKSEKELFEALGLRYIEPELREGLGEIEASEGNELPNLLKANDIKGAFHNHTTASDGRNTLDEMANAAAAMGWEYLGIADHSKSSYQANGLDKNRLLKQVEAIRKYNASKSKKIHVFTGTECDILGDGSLDFSDDILEQLDYVLVSVHNGFSKDKVVMTDRIIKAIENPNVTMLGHLTGRVLLTREGYAVNVQKVVDAAIANHVIIELNANPMRLDMDWRHWHKASDKGLLCSINPDAHAVEQFEFVDASVNIARKGWLTKSNILNTRSLNAVKKYLKC